MFTKRIIPCLDVNNGRVVKGINFVNLRDAGDPVEVAAAYDKAGADEVVFLDITASSDNRGTVVDMVRQVAEKVFKDLGADITVIGNKPDGVNINDSCGSTHPEKLQAEVIRQGALLGLAYDGDADRLIAADEKGRIIDGDKLICICARMMKEKGQLPGDLVTATVMSNLGFHKYIESLGCRTEVTSVGDRYVLESMLKTGGMLGGEQSGHIIFLNHTTTGDGILSSLQLLEAVLGTGRKPSELSDEIKIFPQVLKNARVKNENKNRFMDDDDIKGAIANIENELEGTGRVLIRPSGTEPLVRVMLEGQDVGHITKLAEELAVLLTKRLG